MKYKVISNFFAMGQNFKIGVEVKLPPEIAKKHEKCLIAIEEEKPQSKQKKVK